MTRNERLHTTCPQFSSGSAFDNTSSSLAYDSITRGRCSTSTCAVTASLTRQHPQLFDLDSQGSQQSSIDTQNGKVHLLANTFNPSPPTARGAGRLTRPLASPRCQFTNTSSRSPSAPEEVTTHHQYAQRRRQHIMASSPPNEDHTPTVDSTIQHCAFLSLPPELRNRIYELVTAEIDKALIQTDYDTNSAINLQVPVTYSTRPWHALAFACRQIRDEFAPMLAHARFTTARELVWPIPSRCRYPRFFEVSGEALLEPLPPLPRGGKRTLLKRVFLDADFDPEHITQHSNLLPDSWLEVCFDTANTSWLRREKHVVIIRTVVCFDMDTGGPLVERLGQFLSCVEQGKSSYYQYVRGPFEEAIRRYERHVQQLS